MTYLYGMKQAGREWYFQAKGKLVGIGFECIPTEPCVMVRKGKGVIKEIILFYVNDFFHSSESDAIFQRF